jgi:ATP-binding cassette subfamily E protein 1
MRSSYLFCTLTAGILPPSPTPLRAGMNQFLANLDITFRRDPTNYRPRINKGNSTKDREQKDAGTYYYIGDD